MQLVAYGAHGISTLQVTHKLLFSRSFIEDATTNFSMESIKQTFNGTTGFGNDVSATISRNGDLVYRMYLEHTAKFTQTAGVMRT